MALDENGMQIDRISSVDIVNEYPTTAPLPAITPLERRKPDPLAEFKYHAEKMGWRKAIEEFSSLDDLSTEDRLRLYAQKLCSDYTIDHVTAEMAEGRGPAELEKMYFSAFLKGFGDYKERETGNRDLTDEPTRRMKRKAREDKVQDRVLGKPLSDQQVKYQAAIRALEMLHLNTNQPDYLEQIEKFAKLYQDEYTDYEEVERGQRDHSNMFRS